MNRLKAIWNRLRTLTEKYGYVSTILSLLATILTLPFTCVQIYYWRPPPNVGLEFEGNILGWMRPDFGLQNDLKKMGFKDVSTKTVGMAMYDMLMGWLRNTGHRDTSKVELKVPVDGTLSIMRVSGWPDHPQLLSKDEAVVFPDQYVSLGAMRADDPPFLLTLFCSTGQLTHLKFRYKEGDATNTISYVVKQDPSTHYTRIVPEALWGMDAVELQRLAKKCGIGALVLIGLLGYLQWHRILKALTRLWGGFLWGLTYCRTRIAPAFKQQTPPPTSPMPGAPGSVAGVPLAPLPLPPSSADPSPSPPVQPPSRSPQNTPHAAPGTQGKGKKRRKGRRRR